MKHICIGILASLLTVTSASAGGWATVHKYVKRSGGCAGQEVLASMTALMTNNRALVAEVSQMDNTVDNLNEAIKLYLTKLTRGNLDESEAKRAMEIVSFAINLEHVGDIIDKNLSEHAAFAPGSEVDHPEKCPPMPG